MRTSTLRSRWPVVRVRDVADVVRGSSPRPAGDPRYFGGAHLPWITVADITRRRGVYVERTESMLTELGAQYTRILEPNTLLLSNSGATLGVPKITRLRSGANDGVAALLNLRKVDQDYLYYFLESRTTWLREHLAPGVGQPNLNTELIGGLELALPAIPVQQFIATALREADLAIAACHELLEAKRLFKRELIQQMLRGTIRHRAFIGATSTRQTPYGPIPSDWRYVRLAETARECIQRAGSVEAVVLACTKHAGFVESLEYFGRRVYSDDTSNYKVIRRGQFGFPSNHVEEGSIGYLTSHDIGLVSPIYIVFEPAINAVGEYLYALLKTDRYRQIFASATNSSVDRRGSLRWSAFGEIYVPLPSVAEQKAIAEVIELLGKEIILLQELTSALERQKRSLLTKFLSGEIAVVVP